jgi:glycosyltransferase involved in cell wall biosynthesis
MADKPSASIVIPTRGRPDYLNVTLVSVMPQASRAEAEVIVVSDGPDERTAGVAQSNGASFVSLPEERGVNAARNQGVRSARSDLIVFIDDDVDAPASWLEEVLKGTRAAPDREVFGGPIRPRLEQGPRSCGQEPGPISSLDAGAEDRDIPFVWGTNMAIRRSAFERLGLFADSLSGRGDEEEWELRYTAGGGRIRYLASAGLDHRRAPEDARLLALTRQAYRHGRESRRHDMRSGKSRPIPAEMRILAGCAWHTVRWRCAYGIVMGAKAAGSLREALAHRRT